MVQGKAEERGGNELVLFIVGGFVIILIVAYYLFHRGRALGTVPTQYCRV